MLEERIGRLKLAASPEAFLQVNTPACEEFLLLGVAAAVTLMLIPVRLAAG